MNAHCLTGKLASVAGDGGGTRIGSCLGIP